MSINKSMGIVAGQTFVFGFSLASQAGGITGQALTINEELVAGTASANFGSELVA